jgi:polyphosphate glucokinase
MIDFSKEENILSIDIGGSHIKAAILNISGTLLTNFKKIKTPDPATPDQVLISIKELIKDFPDYSKISVGFPGYLESGIVLTAPNLGNDYWKQVNLQKKLSELLGKPVIVINDADMLGLGVVSGKGFEILITLGTGFGTAFLKDGVLLPHIELAHHPVTKSKDYDAYIGDKALKKHGDKKWNKRVKKVLGILKNVFNYDELYIGGGNASDINFDLCDDIKIVTNEDGIKGGAILWAKSQD